MQDLDAESLAKTLTERSPAGIAEEVRELIVAGTLTAGMRLPTVRDVAAELGMSVGSVASAYGLLREGGLVETRRRGGTRIVEGGHLGPRFSGWSEVDLLRCAPDPHLLPSAEDALLRAVKQHDVNTWSREHIITDLARELSARLTDLPRSFAAVSSGAEGLWLATRAAAEQGATLAVAEPASPGYLAVLESLGLHTLAVTCDEEGPRPEDLEQALDGGAAVFVHCPGGAFSDRGTLSAERALVLEKVLERHPDTLIIEDDPLGPVSEYQQGHSLDVLFPEQTLRVLGFDRAMGIDVRTSVLAGPKALIDRCLMHRSGGVASNSRLLQHALAHMLRDPQVTHRLQSARTHYALRRRLALDTFAETGLTVRSGPASWALWVEVSDERAAALALAGRGVVVDLGAGSMISQQRPGMLRLSIAQLPEDPSLLRELARLVADAASGQLEDVTFL